MKNVEQLARKLSAFSVKNEGQKNDKIVASTNEKDSNMGEQPKPMNNTKADPADESQTREEKTSSQQESSTSNGESKIRFAFRIIYYVLAIPWKFIQAVIPPNSIKHNIL